MIIIGISCFYHDSAAALIIDGEVKAAAHEERFTRIKHDSSFPINALNFCLEYSNIQLEKVDAVVFYEKPLNKFIRLIESYIYTWPKAFKIFKEVMPLWSKEKIYQEKLIKKNLYTISKSIPKIYFSEHHLSHAASAYFCSNFNQSAILVSDGVGEWDTCSIYKAVENKIVKLKSIHFPHSIGLLYSAFTYYLGFKVNSGEYKVMGLAPYGKPKYKDLILDNLIKINDDCSFQLNLEFFNFITGYKMINEKFEKLFNQKARNKNEALETFHMDVASSIQEVTNIVMIRLCEYAKKITNCKNICISGGVALNCVTNTHIYNKKIFDDIYIQPASGDAGCSIGAGLAYYFLKKNKGKEEDIKNNFNNRNSMKNIYLGRSYTNMEIENTFQYFKGLSYKKIENEDSLLNEISNNIISGGVVGWFQGRSEFGPRSLGARSILADPRPIEMQKKLNLKIKFRESFRPFAPAILEECFDEWFEKSIKSEFMLFTPKLLKNRRINQIDTDKHGLELLNSPRSEVNSVTHVDFSARVQSVSKSTNNLFYNLINNFYLKTGIPILINTSFNVRGEPIVENPKDALDCFFSTELDVLVLNNYIINKKENLNLQMPKRFFNED